MEKENLTWEEVSTEHIVQDEWIDFRKSAYRSPDGRIFQPYYSFTRRNYVVIVASEITTEIPAGAIEQKDGEDPAEAALRAAKRELREETGYESDHWRPLLTIPANATICDNYAWLFAAENCRKTSVQELDEMERINVLKHSAEEIDAMLAGGSFPQAVHALAWLLSKQA